MLSMIAGLVIGIALGGLLMVQRLQSALPAVLLVLGIAGLSLSATWEHVMQQRVRQATAAAFVERPVAEIVPPRPVAPFEDYVLRAPMVRAPTGAAAPAPGR